MLSTRKQIEALLEDKWLFLCFISIAVLVLIWVSLKFVKMWDEGMLASTAIAVVNGKVLYRDVFEFWPPLAVYVTALVFKVWGVSVASLRGLFFMLALANFVLAYFLLAQMRIGKLFIACGVTVFLITTFAFVGMNHHWLGMLFLFLSIACMSFLVRSQARRWATLSGSMVGLSMFSMQLEGFVAGLLLGMVLLTHFRAKSHIYIWWISFAPIVVMLLLAAWFFYAHGAIADAWYSIFEFPLVQYRASNGEVASVSQWLLFILVLYIAKKQWSINMSIEWKLWAGASAILQGIFLFSNNSSIATRYSFFAIILILSFLIVAVFNMSFIQKLSRSMTLDRGYIIYVKAALFALIFFLGLFRCSAETIASWRNLYLSTHKVESPAGVMYAREEVAAKTNYVLSYVHKNHKSGQSIYFGPYASYYYLLTKTLPPLAYSQLTPGYNPDWMFKKAVHELHANHVETIVFLPQESPFAFDANNALVQYLQLNYKKTQELPRITFISSRMLYPYMYQVQQANTPHDAIWEIR